VANFAKGKELLAKKKKIKLLFIQLPSPEYVFQKFWGNVPLAAGYLKAMAYKNKLLKYIDIEILRPIDTNLSSDSRLVNLIVNKSPDVLAVSLYIWNSLRSLHMINQVKKKLPNITILCGGSEVSDDSKYILNNPNVDFGFLGESEISFVNFLKELISKNRDFSKVKGIFYREKDRIIINPREEIMHNLDEIPSPFELGFLDVSEYKVVSYESVRGCINNCSYCGVGIRPMRFFSAKRVGNDLKIIIKKRVIAIRFIDSDILLHPYFEQIGEQIKVINRNKNTVFFAFSYPERIDQRIARLFKDCNFDFFELGLQCLKTKTFRNIKRSIMNKQKFIKGIRCLSKEGINYAIDVMIGLPDDTLSDLKKVKKFIDNNRIPKIIPAVLMILPDTPLRKQAKKRKIVFSKIPPYFIKKAPYISGDEIKKAKDLLGVREDYVKLPDLFSENYDLPFRSKLQIKTNNLNLSKVGNGKLLINKLIIDLDNLNYLSFKKKISLVLKNISSPFTFWIKTRDFDRSVGLFYEIVDFIALDNPYLMWNIIIESKKVFSRTIPREISKKVICKENVVADICNCVKPIKICAVFDFGLTEEKEISDLNMEIPVFRSIFAKDTLNFEKDCLKVLELNNSKGIIVSFKKNLDHKDFIIMLDFMFSLFHKSSKDVVFRSYVVRFLWKLFTKKDKNIVIFPDVLESILKLGHKNNYLFIEANTKLLYSLLCLQLEFNKYINNSTKDLNNSLSNHKNDYFV